MVTGGRLASFELLRPRGKIFSRTTITFRVYDSTPQPMTDAIFVIFGMPCSSSDPGFLPMGSLGTPRKGRARRLHQCGLFGQRCLVRDVTGSGEAGRPSTALMQWLPP